MTFTQSSCFLLIFFFSLSTLSAERADLLAITMSPAVENTLSLDTEVAGMSGQLSSKRKDGLIGLPTQKWVRIQWNAVDCLVSGNLFFHQLQSRLVSQLSLEECTKQFSHCRLLDSWR
ncbi:unnamed protein product [Arctogadus glacialis]